MLWEDAHRGEVATGMLIVTASVSTEKVWQRNGKMETSKELWC